MMMFGDRTVKEVWDMTTSLISFWEILTIVLRLCVVDRFCDGNLFGVKHVR